LQLRVVRRQAYDVCYEAAGKRVSGKYVVRDGLITVTASERSMRGMIEDSMLSQETLAKTLLLQLHGMSTHIRLKRARLRPTSDCRAAEAAAVVIDELRDTFGSAGSCF
jgi:hypothetical protein